MVKKKVLISQFSKFMVKKKVLISQFSKFIYPVWFTKLFRSATKIFTGEFSADVCPITMQSHYRCRCIVKGVKHYPKQILQCTTICLKDLNFMSQVFMNVYNQSITKLIKFYYKLKKKNSSFGKTKHSIFYTWEKENLIKNNSS